LGTTWKPVNDVERRLLRALVAGDQAAYFRVLAGADLYLPVLTGAGGADVLTWPVGGVPYLVVFTSVEALGTAIGSRADRWVRTSYPELAAHWPDPAWRLAIDPHLGIGAFLGVSDIARGARGELRLPTVGQVLGPAMPGTDFVPRSEAEWAMARALADGDPGGYFDALAAGPILVPTADDGTWVPTPGADGTPGIAVFTSARLLAAALPGGVAYDDTDLAGLLRGWPAAGYPLRINPGSPVELELSAERVAELVAALDVAADGEERAP
jgi:SseB protein N-terminal domain